MSDPIETVGDVPNDDEWALVTGAHERDRVLEHVGEDPDDWSHVGLFVRVGEGEYTDVLAFAGNTPYLQKSVTRIL